MWILNWNGQNDAKKALLSLAKKSSWAFTCAAAGPTQTHPYWPQFCSNLSYFQVKFQHQLTSQLTQPHINRVQLCPTAHRTFLFCTRRPVIQPTEIEILYSQSVNFWCAGSCKETRCITLNCLFSFNTFNRHDKYHTDPSTGRSETAHTLVAWEGNMTYST